METTVKAAGPLEEFVGPFEPVAYMWQHPGTGLIGFVEYNGNDEFLEQWAHANHPRQIIAPLYAIQKGWALGKPSKVVMIGDAGHYVSEAVGAEIERLRMEAAYYKAGLLKQAPDHVPARVRVLREQFGDGPFRGAGVPAGEHDCRCNKWGAVSVLARDGKPLGLRLDEFEPVAWRENETPNVELTGVPPTDATKGG